MTRFQKALIVRIGFVLVFALSGCTALAPVDLTGGWSAQLLWTSGPATGFVSPFSMDLVLDNRNLSGSLTLTGPGSQSFQLPITSGGARNAAMNLSATGINDLITPAATVAIWLDGEYSEDAMSGTGTQTVNGSTYTFTWEATRISGPPSETAGF